MTVQVHISYLEILNEAGYDLLDPDREVRLLEDLPRVHVLEDEEANIHMRNLSMHTVHTEEEALNLVHPTWPLCMHDVFWKDKHEAILIS